MDMYTRPQDQGQMIETSYGYGGDGIAYKRVHDRSDRSTQWYCGDLDWDREPEHEDHDRAPCVLAWSPCDEPA